MKKVLHICNLGMNGKAVFLCNLLEHTDFSQYDVTILNFWGKIADPIAKKLSVLPVSIINPRKNGFIGFLLELNSLLKNNKYEVIHSHMWDLSGIFLGLAKWHGIPVRAAHSHNSQKVTGRYNYIKEFIRDKVVWNLLKKFIEMNGNVFFACSDLAANWLYTSKINRGGVNIINNGINLSIFKPLSNKQKGHNLLFVGRFIHQKNPMFLMEVFAEYCKMHKDAKLTCVGNGMLRQDCIAYAYAKGIYDKIVFVDSDSDMAKYYQHADAFILPSFYEGLGIVLIEAQAAGCPCLASDKVPKLSDCGLIRYLSLEDGAQSWAKSIDELTSSVLTIDKTNLFEFSSERTAEKIYTIYETKLKEYEIQF